MHRSNLDHRHPPDALKTAQDDSASRWISIIIMLMKDMGNGPPFSHNYIWRWQCLMKKLKSGQPVHNTPSPDWYCDMPPIQKNVSTNTISIEMIWHRFSSRASVPLAPWHPPDTAPAQFLNVKDKQGVHPTADIRIYVSRMGYGDARPDFAT